MLFYGLIPFPIPLPHDILRTIFEFAATRDLQTCLALARVSRMSQRWVDLVLYEVVNLHRQSTSRKFLRTIETSPTKTHNFFATHVKSLCISVDIYDEHTVKIICACQGVTSLTFWIVPVMARHKLDVQFAQRRLTAALTPLRPRRLSVLLRDVLCAPAPQFQLPFFHTITHLAIINRWEEWTTWAGFSLLASLTHLSFDLRVGPQSLCPRGAFSVARAVAHVLMTCPHLRVCVLLLLFDQQPRVTAGAVLAHMAPDPRLVLLRDTEPFRDREAHSRREAEIWQHAEQMAARQWAGMEHMFSEI